MLAWIVLHAVGAVLAVMVRKRDRDRDQRRAESLWKKYGTYLLITGTVLFVGSRMTSAFEYALFALALAMGRELTIAAEGAGRAARRVVLPSGLVFICAGIAGAWCIKRLDLTGDAWGWFWLVVATTDAYSQLFGQGWGEARLAPRLSPGKTWFGFLAGTASAVVAGVLMGFALYPASRSLIALVALLTSLAATAGDLLESWLKRVIGIKDFSDSLGMHGGLLDRFDSLLGAAPVFAFALWWLDR